MISHSNQDTCNDIQYFHQLKQQFQPSTIGKGISQGVYVPVSREQAFDPIDGMGFNISTTPLCSHSLQKQYQLQSPQHEHNYEVIL